MILGKEKLPADEKYLLALGCAVYRFSNLEWSIIWLLETLDEGFLKRSKKVAANTIAKKFGSVLNNVGEKVSNLADLEKLQSDFAKLVILRDSLIHSNPFTDESGVPNLSYNGRHGRKRWTQENIEEFSEEVRSLSTAWSSVFHGENGTYKRYKIQKGRL